MKYPLRNNLGFLGLIMDKVRFQRTITNTAYIEGKLLSTYKEGEGPSHANVDRPWRCLCLGLDEQYIYTRPLRFTVLQNSHIFFTEERTFMAGEK